MQLSTSEKIRILCKRKEITITELAKRMEISSQNLSNKLSRNDFLESDLKKIATALGCHYEAYFILNNKEQF